MLTEQQIFNRILLDSGGSLIQTVLAAQAALNMVYDASGPALRVNLVGGTGPLGLPESIKIVHDTETAITLTSTALNNVHVIDNTSDVVIDIDACIAETHALSRLLFIKKNTGHLRIDPGAGKYIKSIFGGGGYVENATTEQFAILRIMILDDTTAIVEHWPVGTWQFE